MLRTRNKSASPAPPPPDGSESTEPMSPLLSPRKSPRTPAAVGRRTWAAPKSPEPDRRDKSPRERPAHRGAESEDLRSGMRRSSRASSDYSCGAALSRKGSQASAESMRLGSLYSGNSVASLKVPKVVETPEPPPRKSGSWWRLGCCDSGSLCGGGVDAKVVVVEEATRQDEEGRKAAKAAREKLLEMSGQYGQRSVNSAESEPSVSTKDSMSTAGTRSHALLGLLKEGVRSLSPGQKNKNNKVVVAEFLKNFGFDGVNESKKTKLGKITYPLHTAVEKGDLKLVKLLIEEGAQTDVLDGLGRTPAQVAKARGKPSKDAMLQALGEY